MLNVQPTVGLKTQPGLYWNKRKAFYKMKKTKLLLITVTDKTQEAIDNQFKLLGSFCGQEMTEITKKKLLKMMEQCQGYCWDDDDYIIDRECLAQAILRGGK